MDRSDARWQSPASYLYILHLDAPSLAWEYLRRNPQYRADYSAHPLRQIDPRETWHLHFFENPNKDSRYAEILWTPFPSDCVRLARTQHSNAPTVFSLSSIAGHQTLIHDGSSLWLTVRLNTRIFRAHLDPHLTDGDLCAFLVPSGEDTSHHRKARLEFSKACFSRTPFNGSTNPKRPSSIAIFHARALQALDAHLAGASHREIAVAIFGEERVAYDWSADGYLRAQIRHILRRAHHLMNGGYVDLLK